METALPCSLRQGWLPHTFSNRVDFIMLLTKDGGLALWLLWPHSQLYYLSLVLGCVGRASLPLPCYHRTDEKWVQLSYVRNFRAYSPTPPIIGLALLCFPAEVQDLLFQELQLPGTDFLFLWTRVQLSQLPLVLIWGRASLPSLCNCMVDERWAYISLLWA